MSTNNVYAGSWGAHEEHRRTWYGVIALDRLASHLFTKVMLIMLIFPIVSLRLVHAVYSLVMTWALTICYQ